MEKLIRLNEKIYVAGANGMVGKAVIKSLIRFGYGLEKNDGVLLTPSRKDLNLLNYEEVKNWFMKNKPSIVIVAAAKVGGIFANNSNPTEFLLDNLKIQNNLIENAWKSGVKRLLFLGSSCIYPKFAKQPISEESLLTNSLEESNQWYAIAKIAGIKLCEALRKQHKFDAISLMPTNLYGPGDNYHPENSHVMAALIRKFCFANYHSKNTLTCWGTGSPLREFLHVDDLGDAIVFALENWNPDSSNAPQDNKGNPLLILNVGTGKDISIKKLANLIAKKVDYKGEILWDQEKPDGTPKKLLDIRIINQLGWKAEIELEKGIEMTLEDLNKDRKLKYKKLI